jgi:RNA polymerase-binding transcription factor DksA
MTKREMAAPNKGTATLQDTVANGYTHYKRVEPSDAEARAVEAALDLLRDNGYGIYGRCLDCGHPITTAASLSRMRGAHCHAKAAVTR